METTKISLLADARELVSMAGELCAEIDGGPAARWYWERFVTVRLAEIANEKGWSLERLEAWVFSSKEEALDECLMEDEQLLPDFSRYDGLVNTISPKGERLAVFAIPVWALPYVFYGDATGLSEEEIEEADFKLEGLEAVDEALTWEAVSHGLGPIQYFTPFSLFGRGGLCEDVVFRIK